MAKTIEQRAKELGVSIGGDRITVSSTGRHPPTEPQLEQRISEAERSNRERRLFWVAVVGAVASVVGALGAWIAAMRNRYGFPLAGDSLKIVNETSVISCPRKRECRE